METRAFSGQSIPMLNDPPDSHPRPPTREGSLLNLPDERLFEARTVLLFGEITMESARRTTAQLLALDEVSSEPIRVVVNSPGGHVDSGATILDMIRFVNAPVFMLGTGWVASAGALVFIAAKKERRFALPNTRFMLHQPLGGVGGPATDVEIEARQIKLMRQRLNDLFAEATGQSRERIHRDTDRNYWLTAEEAREYGLVSQVVASQADFRKVSGQPELRARGDTD